MARRPNNPNGGGILVLGAALAGTAIGLHFHQVTPGFLIGLAAGSVAALLLWALDRRR